MLASVWTHRDVSPELGHIVVVDAEKLCEPADGSLAPFVYSLIPLKVLIVFVDRVVCQMHVELALEKRSKRKVLVTFVQMYQKVS